MKLVYLLLLFLSFAATLSAHAEPGPPVAAEKKIIAWAVGPVDDIYLSEHVEELERRPVDGVVINLYPDSWSRDPLNRQHRNFEWGGSAVYSVDDFTEVIKRLSGCRFTRLTDNFLDFSTSCRGRSQAHWFDDNWDEVVLNNLVVAATVAREVGFKGLFVDTESYYNHLPEFRERKDDPWKMPFQYDRYVLECERAGATPRSLDECKAKVRERGRSVGKAVTEAYPDIVLFFVWGIGRASRHQQLLMPFVDGILETAGPDVKIYDGGEDGYPRMLYSSFKYLRDTAETWGGAASQVPELFRQRVRYCFGVWVDPYPSSYGGFHCDDLTKNHKDATMWEHTLYNALSVSDKYVWIYTWHIRLWWAPSHPLGVSKGHCQLCPHKEVPRPYLDAMKNCRKAHDLDWTPRPRDVQAYGPAKEWPGYADRSLFAEVERDHDLVADLTDEGWTFFLDQETPFDGMNAEEELWTPIRIGEFWENQGHPYDGMGWYKCWFTVPQTLNGKSLKGRRFLLVYGGVSGTTFTYLRRRQVDASDTVGDYAYGGTATWDGEKWLHAELGRHHDDEQEKMAQGLKRDVSFFIYPGRRHKIVVRVANLKGPGGIWKPVRLYVAKWPS